MSRITAASRRAVFSLAVTTAASTLSLVVTSEAQAAAVLKLTKTANRASVTPDFSGAQLRWTLQYSCISVTDTCTDAVITDDLPAGVTFVSADSGATPTASGARWDLGDLNAGATGTLEIAGSVPCSPTGATYLNSATFSSAGLTSVTKTAPITVNAPANCDPPPAPPYAKSGPSILSPGGRLHYNFTLPARADAYVVEDNLPTNANYVNSAVSAPITATVTCDSGATWVPIDSCSTPSKVRFLVPRVTSPVWKAAGIGVPYTAYPVVRMRVPVTAPLGSSITNNAPIYTATPGGTPGTATGETGAATGNVQAGAPMTSISKWAYKLPGSKDAYNTTPAGSTTSTNEDVGYQISYGNAGGGNAAGANLVNPVITDLLDANTEFITGTNWWNISSAPAGCTAPAFDSVPNFAGTGRTLLRWRFDGCALRYDLDYNDAIAINVTTRMKPGTPANTVIANDAYGQETAGIKPILCDQGLIADALDLDGDGNTTELNCKGSTSFNLAKIATFDSSKWVNGVADTKSTWSRFPSIGQTAVAADGFATYHLFLKSNGNVDTTKLEIVDVLPFIGDSAVSESSLPRLSEWNMKLVAPIVVDMLKYEDATPSALSNLNEATGWSPAGGITVEYSASTNPCRVDGNGQIKTDATATAPAGCDATWTTDASDARAFSIESTQLLRRYNPPANTGDILRITLKVKDNDVAAADANKVAWNSFAYTATDATGQEFLTAEPIKVGVRMTLNTPQQPSLGNYVWYDENRNGIQDTFEEGVDGVLVSLYDAAGNLLQTTTTKADPNNPAIHGYYRFDGLDDTTGYTIKTDRAADFAAGGPLAGFELTGTNSGTDDSLDNDASLVTLTPTITNATTGAGASYTPTYDFGFWQKPNYSLGNRVWFDDDASGAMNGTDAGVDNVVVNVFRKGGDGSLTAVSSDTTKNGGFYRFDGLDAGDFVVQIDPSNFAIGGALEGRRSTSGALQNSDPNTNIDRDDNGVDPASNALYVTAGATGGVLSNVVTLGPGKTEPLNEAELSPSGQGAVDTRANMTVDFGFVTPKFAVGNYVWEDSNSDGLQTATETGINGVSVKLFKADGTPAGTTTTSNGPDGKPGFYLFDDLLAGDYYAEFVKPNATVFTTQTTGTNDAVDSNVDPITAKTANFTLSESLPAVDAALDGAGRKAGNVLRTIDAGIVERYSLGNLVWIDTNDNGRVDEAEAGIDGVTVELHRTNADGTVGALVSTQTTTDAGHYLFTNLAAGEYTVVIPKSQLAKTGPLYGYRSSLTTTSGETQAPSVDTDPTDSDDNGTKAANGDVVSSTVTLGGQYDEPSGEPVTPGHASDTPDAQSNTTVDFGFAQNKFAVGNYVWEDINNDGSQGTDETGINGQTVTLFKADGTEVTTTTTGNGPNAKPGFYLFDNLNAGDYYVTFTKPDGTVFTKTNVGSTALDSNADAVGKTAIFTLDDSLAVTTVDNDGNVKATYINRDIDAGISKRYSVGNLVWNDANGDSKVSDSEKGIDGVVVELRAIGVDGNPGALVSTQTTSDGGHYLFTDLVAGEYVVVLKAGQTPLAGFHSSATSTIGEVAAALSNDDADSDDNGYTSANGDVVSSKITLGPTNEPLNEPSTPGHGDTTIDANSNATVDFGFVTMSLGNLVWEDTDNSGTRNTQEPAMAGVKVLLYVDNNADGNPDGLAISTQVTNADGQYLFTGLKPGKYVVEIESPAGFYSSSGTAGSYSGPFEPGKGDNTAADTQDHGTTVGNRIRSATIMLVPGAEPLEAIETDSVVRTLTNPASDATTDSTVDFGLVPGASIGNYVWLDNNRDGVQNEAPDAGINVVTVYLIDKNGKIVKTTVTGADPDGKPGFYRFDVIPGEYNVRFDLATLPDGMVVSPKGKGSDAAKDSDVDATTGETSRTLLDPREDDPTWDLGVYPTAAVVGNFVWLDVNNDGIQNDGPDSGFKGVKVTLLAANGTPVTRDVQGNPMSSTVITDGAGQYLFTNLKPGKYTVKFEAPEGYEPTISSVGDGETDSNGLTAMSKSLKGGQSDLSLDLGLVKIKPPVVFDAPPAIVVPASVPSTTRAPATPPSTPASEATPTTEPVGIPASELTIPTTTVKVNPAYTIRGSVYLDANRTAEKDGSEPGRAGVVVRLFDAQGKLVATTTTDENGNYGFAAEPGDYEIAIEKPNGLNSTTTIRKKISVLGVQNQQTADFGLAAEAADLALTGSSSNVIGLWGSLFVMIGVVAVRLGRRRPTKK
jgi:hypothetical protein